MEASEPTPTPPAGSTPSGRVSGDDLRDATFPQALRGYDREAVHALLDRVADWVEGRAGAVAERAPAMREELAKVGERTAGILTAAEEAATNLRDDAVEYAERLRADAEEEARKQRLNASQRMDEMISDAESKAEAIIDDALARRRKLNQAISSLVDRRDEIASETARLADELLTAVDKVRSSTAEEPEAPDPEVESEDAVEAVEPDTPAGPSKLLVDPDEEETRIHDADVTQPHPPPQPHDDRT